MLKCFNKTFYYYLLQIISEMEFNNELYDDNEGQNEFEETEDQEDEVQEYYPPPKTTPVKRKPRQPKTVNFQPQQIQPQPIQYNPYDQYQAQGAAATQSTEIPTKKRGRPKKVLEEPQDSYEQQVSKPRKVAQQPVPQEQHFDHQCLTCGSEFDCQDGKLSKAGAFKCSCVKAGRGKNAAFFCNDNCLANFQE